jgi:hypothetical protein
VTAATLKRRIRQGTLVAYRPGKAHLATLAGVREMLQQTRVVPTQRTPPVTSAVPNSLGLTEMDLASIALDSLLEGRRAERTEKKRIRDEERARPAPAHHLEMQERRRKRARLRYRTKKAELARVGPK